MMRMARLYFMFISVQVRSQMQYRSSFLLETLAAALANGLGFLTIALVLQRFETVGGWNLAQVAFLFGLVDFSFGLMDMIFSGFDPDGFSVSVRTGGLDQLFLRPVNITLQVFGSRFIWRRVGRMLQGLLVFVLAISLNDIQWTAGKLVYLPVVVLSMVAYFGGLFMVGSTLTFWTGERIEAINVLTYGGSEMISYPMQIYPAWMRQFFTFILPAMFLNFYPALYFLDIPDPLGFPAWAKFLAPAAGLGVLAASHQFWLFGLRHYQSTGT